MNFMRRLFSVLFVFSFLLMACQAVNRTFDIPLLPGSGLLGEALPLSYEKQFNIFDELWNIVNEEYLYEDFNGVDWEAIYQEYAAVIEGGLDDAGFYQTMREMIYTLNDEHSAYLSPEEVLEEDAEYAGDSNFVGIGIWVAAVEERDRAVILLVFPDSPAEAAGVKAHDSILAVEKLIEKETIEGEELDAIFDELPPPAPPETVPIPAPAEVPAKAKRAPKSKQAPTIAPPFPKQAPATPD